TSFVLSGNYRNENTILPGKNNYLRAGFLSQIHHKSIDERFQITLSNHFNAQINDQANPSGTIHSTYLAAPNYPLYLADGSFNLNGSNIAAGLEARSKTHIDNLITNLNLIYKVIPQLSVKVNAGYTSSNYDQTLIFPTESLFP